MFEYTAEGYQRRRTTTEDGKSIAELEFSYDGNAMVKRDFHPGNNSITSTLNEFGSLASSQRKGTLKEKFVNTINTRSIYEGDAVILYVIMPIIIMH